MRASLFSAANRAPLCAACGRGAGCRAGKRKSAAKRVVRLPDVQIISRKEAERLCKTDLLRRAAVISFYDPPDARTQKGSRRVDYRKACQNVFFAGVRDLDIEVLAEYGLTYDTYFPQAPKLAAFILRALRARRPIVCQCEYGQSRSAACAAAIREFCDGSGIRIFADYRYYPNQLIFNKLLLALAETAEKEARRLKSARACGTICAQSV